MSTYDQLPVAQCPLNARERDAALSALNDFLAWAGAPGDWGYQSKLGVLTKHLHNLRAEIVMAPPRQEEA